MSSFFGSPTPDSASGDPQEEEISSTPPPSETTASPDVTASLNLEMLKLLADMQQQQQQLQKMAQMSPPVQSELPKPQVPINGGLVLSNKTWEAWTGGKPKFD